MESDDESSKLAVEEVIIDQVRERPALYDKSHPDYNSRLVKDNIWKEIGKELKIPGKI